MDTHTVLECCLAVPGGHSDPGFAGGSQPLHRAGVLEHASRRWSLPCCSASSPGHSGLPGTTPTVEEASHLAPVRSLSGPGRGLCGHSRLCSTPCRLPPRAGSGALCSGHNHRVAFANGGAGRDPNALHFAAPRSHGRERIFGSRLNQERPFPVLSLRRLLQGKTDTPMKKGETNVQLPTQKEHDRSAEDSSCFG